MVFEWKDPPEKTASETELLKERLRERPGMWAMVDKHTGIKLNAPYLKIDEDSDFEIRVVRLSENALGPKEIYARYIGAEK